MEQLAIIDYRLSFFDKSTKEMSELEISDCRKESEGRLKKTAWSAIVRGQALGVKFLWRMAWIRKF
jgi:hypothetical protein